MIACFLSNISAKYYKNLSMLSRVIAKNVRDVFLRHSVYCLQNIVFHWPTLQRGLSAIAELLVMTTNVVHLYAMK